MHTTNLRKVGGSIMFAIPPSVLDLLGLHAGSTVGLVIEHDRLVIETKPKVHYSLVELLNQCDLSIAPSEEDKQWLDNKPTGKEIL
jgi:antitoxin ChpS